VATLGKSALSSNPEGALLEARKPACGFRFSEVTIPSFVILHARLGDEQCPVGQRPHHIGQIVMGLVLEHVANRKGRVFRNGQAIGRGKRLPNVAPRVALHLGMVFEPQQEAFFELATERLPDSRTRFEARHPSRNGAARNFE
jgi:hypothetical protein